MKYTGPHTLGVELAELESLALPPESSVWIVGAFKGTTAEVLTDLYHPNIHVFDPQPHAVEHLRKLAETNPRVTVHPYGLGKSNGRFPMPCTARKERHESSASDPHRR